MKRLLVFCVLLMVYCQGFAQITWDSDDLLKTAKTYHINQVPDSAWYWLYAINVGDAGSNQLYDFRLLDSTSAEKKELRIRDSRKHGFSKAFPDANAILFDRGFFEYSRGPIALGTEDFPKKTDTIEYAHMQTTGRWWDRYVKVRVRYGNTGEDVDYDMDVWRAEYDDTTRVGFVDPAKTPWKDDFPLAEAARVTFEQFDARGNLQYRVYEFYMTDKGEFVKLGVGAELDKGLLASGSPSGEYVHVATGVSHRHVVNYSDLEIGQHYVNESTWRAQTKQGYTTLKHFDYTLDTAWVSGYGTLYLPQDSFQVFQVQRQVKRLWIDTVSTPFTEEILADSESVFTYEFYAKGYGLPIAEVVTREGRSYDPLEVKHITTKNSVPFTPVIADTVVAFFDLLNIGPNAVHTVGKSIVVDTTIFGSGSGLSGVFDTINSPFDRRQLHSTADFAFGFEHTDTAFYSYQVSDFPGDTSLREITLFQKTFIDGYGKLLLGEDSVDVLRRWVITRDSTKETETYNGHETWSYSYWTYHYELQYLAKGFGYPVVRIEFYEDDSTDIQRVTFMDLSPDIPTAEGKPESDGRLQVYPNPATNRVYIQMPIADGNYELGIYDLKGSLVSSATGAEQLVFDVGGFEKGVYMVRATHLSSGTVAIAKLVVR